MNINRFLPHWIAVCLSGLIALAPALAQADKPIRILCVGDSITAGYTNPKWQPPFEFGYRSGLYTRLLKGGYHFQFVGASPQPWSGAYPKPTNEPVIDLRKFDQDHHRGYGGIKTVGVLGQIRAWISADDPDLILLMVGINDGGKPEAKENLNKILQAVFAAKPGVGLIVAQITPKAKFVQAIVDYNTYIRETLVPSFQAQGRRITTVDQYANLLKDGAIDESLFSNGINHPGPVAYDRMAQTWYEGIRAFPGLPDQYLNPTKQPK